MHRPKLTILNTNLKINNVPLKDVKLSREELIKKNSVTLNIIAFMIFMGICYFLYSIYLERKLINDYADKIASSK